MYKPHFVISSTAFVFGLPEEDVKKLYFKLLCALLVKLTRLTYQAIGALLRTTETEVKRTIQRMIKAPELSLNNDIEQVLLYIGSL